MIPFETESTTRLHFSLIVIIRKEQYDGVYLFHLHVYCYQEILGMSWIIIENPAVDCCDRKILFKSNRTEKFLLHSEQASKVQDCHLINDFNGETISFAPQYKQSWSSNLSYHYWL